MKLDITFTLDKEQEKRFNDLFMNDIANLKARIKRLEKKTSGLTES